MRDNRDITVRFREDPAICQIRPSSTFPECLAALRLKIREILSPRFVILRITLADFRKGQILSAAHMDLLQLRNLRHRNIAAGDNLRTLPCPCHRTDIDAANIRVLKCPKLMEQTYREAKEILEEYGFDLTAMAEARWGE